MTKVYFNQQAHIWDEEIAEKDTVKLQYIADCLTIKSGSIILDIKQVRTKTKHFAKRANSDEK